MPTISEEMRTEEQSNHNSSAEDLLAVSMHDSETTRGGDQKRPFGIPAPSTAPPSPGLSHVESVTSPSRRSLEGGATAPMGDCFFQGSDEDEKSESAAKNANFRLCAAAAACFVRLFQNNGRGKNVPSVNSNQVQSRAQGNSPTVTTLHVQAQLLVFTPLRTLVDGGFCSKDTLTFALVIANRLAASGFAISWANCRRVLLCVIMLAGKIHADEYYTFSTLAACVGIPVTANTMSSLAQCEWKICVALDFALQCSLEEYNAVVEDAFPSEQEIVLLASE